MVGNNFSAILNDILRSLSLPWNSEPVASKMRGCNIIPKIFDQDLDVQEDAARASNHPVSRTPNLDVYLDSLLEKLEWETRSHTKKPFADGVTFSSGNGTVTTLRADREVVLSAGSPRSWSFRVLAADRKVLEKNDINIVMESPFVGETLQNQTTVDIIHPTTQNFPGAGGFIRYSRMSDILSSAASNLSQQIKASLASHANRIAGVPNLSVLEKPFQIQHALLSTHKPVNPSPT